MNAVLQSAKDAGYAACHACNKVTRWQAPSLDEQSRCPRCNSVVHQRKPDSITRTWAYLIAATVLYIPANTLPVLTVLKFGSGDPDTILSGVQVLFADDQPIIALIVFTASFVVPILKIVGLSILLISIQAGWNSKLRDRTILFRSIEIIGRWSMLDVLVVGILISLVRMGSLASVSPGPGATAFGAVVVLTMLAAHSFDPRLMWDAAEDS